MGLTSREQKLLAQFANNNYGLYNKTFARKIGLHESIFLGEIISEIRIGKDPRPDVVQYPVSGNGRFDRRLGQSLPFACRCRFICGTVLDDLDAPALFDLIPNQITHLSPRIRNSIPYERRVEKRGP